MKEDILSVAGKYHDLDPADVDEILAPEFRGEYWGTSHTWDRESHRKYLSLGGKRDVIHEQFGEGGKITHVWEMMNIMQYEDQLPKT